MGNWKRENNGNSKVIRMDDLNKYLDKEKGNVIIICVPGAACEKTLKDDIKKFNLRWHIAVFEKKPPVEATITKIDLYSD